MGPDSLLPGRDPALIHRILSRLVRGPSGIVEWNDAAGFRALGAVVDTCENRDGVANLEILAARERKVDRELLQGLLPLLEDATRLGPRRLADLEVRPEWEGAAEVLTACGYTPAFTAFRMARPAGLPLIPPRTPLPEGCRWEFPTPERASEVRAVVAAAFGPIPGSNVPDADEMAQAMREAPRNLEALISPEGRIWGFVVALRGEIRSLGRDPEVRGFGLGDHLLRRGLERLGTNAPAELDVVAENERALALYHRYGFAIRESVVTWRKDLSRSV